MSENVKVIVRCRPMSQKEISKKCDNIVDIGNYVVSVLNPSARSAPRKSFTFDSVYDGLSSTETIYDDICYSLVESTLEGYNGTIFAYGQTGCGKTYTMQDGPYENASHNGIIPRCFDHIFETISISSSVRYLALISYLEIYNENIRDLLCGSEPAGYLQNHALKDLPGVGVTVPSLSSKSVMNSRECYNWLHLGNKNRITGTTLMNDNSSRSHTIFTITLEQIQGTASSSSSSSTIRRGKLNLVDLAGSERQSKTGAFGERLKEATKINLSLSALGNVISALVDSKSKHVPYRDSKLTRLLQDSLGGNTKTVMISCISPADINYDETLSTLRYASRAKSIANKPRINEDPKDAQLRQYQEEILKLKRLLGESQQLETLVLKEQKNVWLEGEKEKLRQTIIADMINRKQHDVNSSEIIDREKIDLIKHALIGGERVNDIQLRERHRKRKLEAQRHLSAIAHALSRVENEDRDLLQGHYASIQQEINIKNDRIKMCTQKIKVLEREIADLNSEFQLDREDYLEEIRQLNRQIQFYNLLLNKVQPILRKNGRYWNPEKIMESSVWNDDQKIWILPNFLNTLRLPPANLRSAFQKPAIKSIEDNNNVQYRKVTSTDSSDSDITRNRLNLIKSIYSRTTFEQIARFLIHDRTALRITYENIVDIGNYVVSVLNPSARSAPRKSFTFDSVYDGLSSTETIYDDICYSLVESTLEGYNGTIFAYGQTGCGKTYTMQDGPYENASHNGIIPRCFDHIFETISISSSVRYLALISYLEIYNENIRDLLCGSEPAGYLQNHALKDLPGVGVTVPSLSSKSVMNSRECYNWLHLGNKNRITGTTLMNDNSSRSHTIFTITLEQIQGTASSSSSSSTIRRGKLNLVDLAGSERQSKTGAFGERLKEATKINLSLSALGNVISALVDSKSKHVPYRDSKLTRLLQDSLGGNTKTVMISCISPADINYDETLSTLRYASRAKSIANKPRINEDPKDAQLRQYQEEILKLKRLLGESQQLETLVLKEQKNVWLEGEKEKLRQTIIADMINRKQHDVNSSEIIDREKIDLIKHALIGGERVNDIQLRERHRKRKLEAQRHLSAIAHALSRVENEDRDLLQGHYASIQQEINIKNDRIKMCTQKIKVLEREIADLNSEFQLDREDYLEEIRQLNRQIQFYNLLLNKVQPILRKNGRYWNPEKIMESSVWNDDQKIWILPNFLNTLRLPPANLRSAFQKPAIKSIEDNNNVQYRKVTSTDSSDSDIDNKESPESYKIHILKNYFRTNRKIPNTRSNSSQDNVRDFVLRKATPLPLNEYRSPLFKSNAIKTDFGRGKTVIDKSWSSLCVTESKHATDFKE